MGHRGLPRYAGQGTQRSCPWSADQQERRRDEAWKPRGGQEEARIDMAGIFAFTFSLRRCFIARRGIILLYTYIERQAKLNVSNSCCWSAQSRIKNSLTLALCDNTEFLTSSIDVYTVGQISIMAFPEYKSMVILHCNLERQVVRAHMTIQQERYFQ